MDVTKDQVIEAMSFIWVTYRSKNDSQTAESPKPTLVWVISQKKLGSQSTQCSLQAAQEVESMFSRDRPNPPQSNLIVFCLSQSDGLVAASSLQLGLFIFWKKGSNDFVQFQRLLEEPCLQYGRVFTWEKPSRTEQERILRPSWYVGVSM